MEVSRFTEITDSLKGRLDAYRYAHTLGVAFTAAAMAMKYCPMDVEKALTAGLLHDCAKCIPNSEKYAMCEHCGVELTEYEKRNPSLVHAKLGAYIAEHEYGVTDKAILDAISTHTTGTSGMSVLQKILYVADFIDPNRDDFIPDMPIYRQTAFENLDRAVYMTIKNTLDHLQDCGKEIDPITMTTFEYYKELI